MDVWNGKSFALSTKRDVYEKHSQLIAKVNNARLVNKIWSDIRKYFQKIIFKKNQRKMLIELYKLFAKSIH